jgi:hypothetical protein
VALFHLEKKCHDFATEMVSIFENFNSSFWKKEKPAIQKLQALSAFSTLLRDFLSCISGE